MEQELICKKDYTSPLIMILMKGHPGYGKSTLAFALAKSLKFPLIDKDDARDSFTSFQKVDENCIIDWNALSYEVMFRTAETQLKLGLSVVIDCPLARKSLFQTATEIAKKYGSRILVVECECGDLEVWKARLKQRSEDTSNNLDQVHKPQSWEEVQQLLERYDGCWRWTEQEPMFQQEHLPTICLIKVDTSLSVQHNVECVFRKLNSLSQKKLVT
eukprot:TRINITY_DN3076_c1_g1_i1.p1 TRINITY_DN3076_c1_g1~~TRINITY_DN3076_c1_g1_i1.p1  ORF type:complete len:254 (-),score=19.15 TRINITY_DN3076_c1_g1_i1:495-1142(-)